MRADATGGMTIQQVDAYERPANLKRRPPFHTGKCALLSYIPLVSVQRAFRLTVLACNHPAAIMPPLAKDQVAKGETKMKKAIALATLMTLATGCTPAVAGNNHWDDGRGPRYREYYDYAKVVDVDPIVRVVRVSAPRQECWSEPVNYHEPGGSSSYTGTIVGGIIGGAVGNQFGKGRGKDAATIAGTLLGASIGRDLSNNRPGRTYTAYEDRCRMVPGYAEEERVDGYQVTYRYRNETYTTRMPYHPGNRVRVQVSERPASYRVAPAF